MRRLLNLCVVEELKNILIIILWTKDISFTNKSQNICLIQNFKYSHHIILYIFYLDVIYVKLSNQENDIECKINNN